MPSLPLHLLLAILSAHTALSTNSSSPFTLSTYFTNFPGFGTPLINAIGGYFWVGKPTQSYCPSVVANITTCPTGNVTSFVSGNSYGTLSLNTMVPGGQQGTWIPANNTRLSIKANDDANVVYIDPNGFLRYTVPHSGYIPPGSLTTGLLLNETSMQLNRYFTFWLCNQDEESNVWRVGLEYESEDGSIKVAGKTEVNACTRFQLHGDYVEGVGAWEYA